MGNPIVEIRRSDDRLISTKGFHILIRWHLCIESGPWSLALTEVMAYQCLGAISLYDCLAESMPDLTHWPLRDLKVIYYKLLLFSKSFHELICCRRSVHENHQTFLMAGPKCLMRFHKFEHNIQIPSDKCLMNHESFSGTLMLSTSCETSLKRVPENPINDKSNTILVQVMTWCLNQCWPRSVITWCH